MRELLLIVSLVILSCSQSDKQLSQASLVTNIFTKNEIADLEKLLTFFETKICENENVSSENVLDCYKAFFIRMDKDEGVGIYDVKIPFAEQKLIYEQIETNTFNKLWQFGRSWKFDSPDTMKYVTYNFNGSYGEFLRSFGAKNERIQDYYEACLMSGGISPSQSARILKLYDQYNVQDVKMRLFIAIHYLTLNDQFERIEKY